MESCDYRFAVEILRFANNERVGSFPVTVDWEPAIEYARFELVRRADDSPAVPPEGPIRIEPVWDPKLGEPYLRYRSAVRRWL